MSDKDGGAAFTQGLTYKIGDSFLPTTFEGGMTLRDYFAGQVLAGWAANSNVIPEAWSDKALPIIAAGFYKMADAMLAERKKGDSD